MNEGQERRFKLKLFGIKIKTVRCLAEEGGDFIDEVRRDPFFFQEQRIADALNLNADAWSKVKSGTRGISAAQLQLLAQRFKLDACLGPVAWRQLLDETSVANFRDMLQDCGYGKHRPKYDSIQAVLDDLVPLGPSLVGLDLEIVQVGSIAQAACYRKFMSPDQAEAEARSDALPVEARVRIRLDLDRPSHVVVLDLCAGTYGGKFQVTVLAPSFLCRTTPLPAGQTLPTQGTGRVIVVGPPPDRHHLLAFISDKPLEPLPWLQQEGRFPELNPGELRRFIDGVCKRGAGAVRVLSRPYRVVGE